MKKRFPFLPLIVMFAGCAIDRLIKILSIPLAGAEPVSLIPGVAELTYVQNTGISFGLLSGSDWLPILLAFIIISGILLFLFFRPAGGFPGFLLGCILAGALGNLIDRLFLGYVIDMFHFTFFQFPVFNFADILITCGCIVLMLVILFQKDPKKTDFPKEG